MKLYAKVFTGRLVYFVIDKQKRHLLEGQLAQLQKSGCNKRLSGAFLKVALKPCLTDSQRCFRRATW